MNYPNRSTTTRINKTLSTLIDTLKSVGVSITAQQESLAVATIVKKTEKRSEVDMGMVKHVAEDLGLNVNVAVRGRKSMSLSFNCDVGGRTFSDGYIDVSCTGEKYWIEVSNGVNDHEHEKWCMPRNEVSSDRADKFLIEVLKEYTSAGMNLKTAVSITLGIDGAASIGHTKSVLAKLRLRPVSYSKNI